MNYSVPPQNHNYQYQNNTYSSYHQQQSAKEAAERAIHHHFPGSRILSLSVGRGGYVTARVLVRYRHHYQVFTVRLDRHGNILSVRRAYDYDHH